MRSETSKLSMQTRRSRLLLWLILCSCSVIAETKVLYENDFSKAELGRVPDDFKVLEGGFLVKAEEGNKLLELPGAPLDAFTVLFGPTASSNVMVSARIQAQSKGRRFPPFGVGV